MSGRAGYITQEAMKKVIETVGRHKGVYGAVICALDGLPLQSNLDVDTAEEISAQMASFVGKLRQVCREVANEEVMSVRLEFERGDVEVIPDFETEITIIALVKKQRPTLK